MRCTPGLSPVLFGAFVTTIEFARNPSRWKFAGILTPALVPADGVPAVPVDVVCGAEVVGALVAVVSSVVAFGLSSQPASGADAIPMANKAVTMILDVVCMFLSNHFCRAN